MGRLYTFLGMVTSFVLLAPLALAQDAGDVGYGGAGGVVQEELGGVADAGTSGVLPFTGLDLAFLVAAGIALLVTGLLLRRFGPSRRA